jgi:hypothetical protein
MAGDIVSTYVIGVFECGCSNESSYSGTEVVKCGDQSEVASIVCLMKQHSVGFQCHSASASSIIVVDGTDIAPKFLIRDNVSAYWDSHAEYDRVWDLSHAEKLKEEEEQRKYLEEMKAKRTVMESPKTQ